MWTGQSCCGRVRLGGSGRAPGRRIGSGGMDWASVSYGTVISRVAMMIDLMDEGMMLMLIVIEIMHLVMRMMMRIMMRMIMILHCLTDLFHRLLPPVAFYQLLQAALRLSIHLFGC